MFVKKHTVLDNKDAILVTDIGKLNLYDTFECGQAFRYELITRSDGYTEYMTVAYGRVIRVGQRNEGELIFYGMSEEDFYNIAVPYFSLDRDYAAIGKDIISRTDSEWLKSAAEAAAGIRILKQEPWETLFSFIISQNNNIPRIRKIIRSICLEYGTLCIGSCPLGKSGDIPEICKECGACYSFPTARQILEHPEGLLPSKPGFRYKYLLDAASKVDSGEINLSQIESAHSYEYTVSELKKICGVGDKVASCAALFGFANLEAFPIDVWMKRAIDEYFDGSLDPKSLGNYAGIAQQYIFHYIRNLSKND